MSAYISFYLKTNSNEYVPIGTFSRADIRFKMSVPYASYGKNIPVTKRMLTHIINGIEESIVVAKKSIASYQENIEMVKQLNGYPLEVILDKISDFQLMIDECTEDIGYYRDALEYFNTLGLIHGEAEDTSYYSEENRQIDAETYIWMGYEAPWPDEEKN